MPTLTGSIKGNAMWKLLFVGLLAGCSTYTTRSCEQQAWEAAGNAMSNTQYGLEQSIEWDKQVNCSSPTSNCINAPIKDTVDTGQVNGINSQTNYKGLSSREAYDLVISTCVDKK